MTKVQYESGIQAIRNLAASHSVDSPMKKISELNLLLLASHDALLELARSANIEGDRKAGHLYSGRASAIRLMAEGMLREMAEELVKWPSLTP